MHVSIVTTCKGYYRHLEQSLPAMLNQIAPEGVTFDVIVVDYGCPDGTYERLRGPEWDRPECFRLRAAYVMQAGQLFNGPHARNIGARLTRADVIFFNDADDIPPPDAMAKGVEAIRSGVKMVNWTRKFDSIDKPSCFGSAMVVRDVWSAVRGYDERLGGRYGLDDADFYRRVHNDFDFVKLTSDDWTSSPQTHGECTRFFETQDQEASKLQNQQLIWSRGGLVNVNGFGLADLHLYGGPLPEYDGWMSWAELAWLYDRAGKIPAGGTWMEIGTYFGRSFHRTAMGLPQGSRIISVDTFDSVTANGRSKTPSWAILGRTLADLQVRRPDLELALMTPAMAADLVQPETVDGIFVDALHDGPSVEADLDRYWPMLKPGAIVSGHDYSDEYKDLCEVIDRRFPERTVQHTIWETRKPT